MCRSKWQKPSLLLYLADGTQIEEESTTSNPRFWQKAALKVYAVEKPSFKRQRSGSSLMADNEFVGQQNGATVVQDLVGQLVPRSLLELRDSIATLLECTICFEIPTGPDKPQQCKNCSRVVCHACFDQLIGAGHNPACPMCRSAIATPCDKCNQLQSFSPIGGTTDLATKVIATFAAFPQNQRRATNESS